MKIVFLFLFLLCTSVSFAETAKRFEQNNSKNLTVTTYYPSGENKGYYYPGEVPTFLLAIKSNADHTDAAIRVTVKDFDGKVVSKFTVNQKLERDLNIIRFKAPAQIQVGFYVLNTEILENGKQTITTQSAFTVVRPLPSGKRDPFFGLDCHGIYYEMLEGYRRLGAGSLGWHMVRIDMKDPAKEVPRRLQDIHWKSLLESDFTLVGYLPPTILADPKAAKVRIQQGLPMLSEAEVFMLREYIKQLISATKGRIRLWLLASEFDATFRHPEVSTGSSTAILANYTFMAKTAYKEIKKYNPNANIAVLGIMGIDYYDNQPTFKLSKMVLDDLQENFDLLCIDGYNGNWNGMIGAFPLPEEKLRDFLLASAKLSAAYNRPGIIINAENGYSYDYYTPFDSDISKLVTQYTARRLVINRSVPSPFCSWHMGSTKGTAYRIFTKRFKPDQPAGEMAIGWKTILGEKYGEYATVPKMAGAAYATAVRVLSYVKPDKEIRLGSNVYCYTFTNTKGESIVAMWSIAEAQKITLDLPAATVKTDMIGRTETLSRGKNTLLLTKSPIYLTVQGNIDTLRKSIEFAQISVPVPVSAEGYSINANQAVVFLKNHENKVQNIQVMVTGQKNKVSLNPYETKQITVAVKETGENAILMENGQSLDLKINLKTFPVKLMRKPLFDGSAQWFAQASCGKLVTPDDVYPKTAMIPEWGLFKLDGSDISADYAFGYDQKNLYFGVKVKDRKHLQRYTGPNLWKDDSIQFAFTTRLAVPKQIRDKVDRSAEHGKNEYNLSFAWTSKGTELYAHLAGPKSSGYLNWESKVTSSNGYTVYEVAIPLADLGIKPGKGKGLRFSFSVIDNNRPEDKMAKYYLSFGHGVTDGQDISRFNTLTFK